MFATEQIFFPYRAVYSIFLERIPESFKIFRKMKTLFLAALCCLNLFGCSTDKEKLLAENSAADAMLATARVVSVDFSGEANAFTFEVTLESPDTGCDQYADWWEVVDLDGNLLYRRVLEHSHVMEQPFTRDGGPVDIAADKEVYVRMHMNNSGYVAQAQKGSVQNGFQATELDTKFAEDNADQEPLPTGCAF